MQVEFLDHYSRRTSPIHQLDARFKIVAACALIGLVLITSLDHWLALMIETVAVLLAYAATGVPWGFLLSRLLCLLPFLLLAALGVPLSHGLQSGWNVTTQSLARGLLTLTIMLTVIASTPFPRLLEALERLCVPKVLVWVLAFMYRYLFVLSDECQRLHRGRQARQFGQRAWQDWWWFGNSLGVLFLRAFERAERVHAAMCARNWDEHLPYGGSNR